MLNREARLFAEVLHLFDIKHWNNTAVKTLLINYFCAIFFGSIPCFVFYRTGETWAIFLVVFIIILTLYGYLRKHFVIATFGHTLSVKSLGEIYPTFPPVRKISLFSNPERFGSGTTEKFAFIEFYGGNASFPKQSDQTVIKHDLHEYFVIPATKEFINGFCLDADRKKHLLATSLR